MYLVAIAWMYVVLMMAVAEALAPNGTVLGAVFTLLFYGLLPVSVLMYILGTPMRRRARLRAEAEAEARARAAIEPTAAGAASPALQAAASGLQPDRSGHATGDAVAAERKEL